MVELVFTGGNALCIKSNARVDTLEASFSELISTFDPIFILFDKVNSSVADVKSGMKSAGRTAKSLGKVIDKIRVPVGPILVIKEVSELALGAAGALSKSIARSLTLLEAQLAPLNAIIEQVRDLLNKPFLIFEKARQAIIWVQVLCLRLIPQEKVLITATKRSEKNAEILGGLWIFVQDIIDRLLKKVEDAVRALTKKIKGLANDLGKAIADLAKVLPGFNRLKEILDGIEQRVSTLLDAAGPLLETVDAVLDGAQAAASDMLDYLVTLPGVGDAVRAAREAGNSLLETIDKIKQAMRDTVAKAIKDMGLLDAITKPIDAMLKNVSAIAEALKRKVRPTINRFIRNAKKMMKRFGKGGKILLTFLANKIKVEVLIKEWRAKIKALIEAFKNAVKPEREDQGKAISDEARKLGRVLGDIKLSMRSTSNFDYLISRNLNRLAATVEFAAVAETEPLWESRLRRVSQLDDSMSAHFEAFAPLQDAPLMQPGYFEEIAEVVETGDDAFQENVWSVLEVEKPPTLDWLPVLGEGDFGEADEGPIELAPYEPDTSDLGPLISDVIEQYALVQHHHFELEKLRVRAELE